MVRQPKEWPWSSYRARAGLTVAHPCLTTDWILAGFGRTKKIAQERYGEFVKEGKKQPSIWLQLCNQIYLGDEAMTQAYLSGDHTLVAIGKHCSGSATTVGRAVKARE